MFVTANDKNICKQARSTQRIYQNFVTYDTFKSSPDLRSWIYLHILDQAEKACQ
jgi:hypothetical protein